MPTNLFSRRQLLKYASASIALLGAGFGLSSLKRFSAEKVIPGTIVGANAKIGHLIRAAAFAVPTSVEEVDTLIVGGGMSGLSAAWWLEKNNYKSFKVLELDTKVGGNSTSGENSVSAFPWGAHYLPLPTSEAKYVIELLKELKVITGEQNGSPVYDEFYLCADPDERLFYQGKWHDGLIPQVNLTEGERKQYAEFFAYVENLKKAHGKDGRPAFTIPLAQSSQDPEFLKLDKVSMSDFMKAKGWESPHLNWYVNYCCRDDFGQKDTQVSAWVGLHYFASRSGTAANSAADTVLTWPEGNGWLANRLHEKLKTYIQPNSLVFKIEESTGSYNVDYFDVPTESAKRIRAKNVIYAAPRFTAKFVFSKNISVPTSNKLTFVPWMVANITLSEKPEGRGQDLSWDNVSYYSKSLGYIVATHQDVTRSKNKTVITYYLPLDDSDALTERKLASERTHKEWTDIVVSDLVKMHRGIDQLIESVDVCVWGHGMVGPGIDFIWSDDREQMQKSVGNIHFAHTDMSGISVFEEAQYQGVEAAKKVLKS